MQQTPAPKVRVLVVDDEELAREAAATMLEALGHEVFRAGDGEEALARLEADGCDFDLVLLDLTMPRLSGEATYRRIRELPKPPPVILMSGYSAEDVERSWGGSRPPHMLMKPFRLAALSSVVAEALGQGEAAP